MKNPRMAMAVLAALLVLPVTEATSQTTAEQAECQLVLNSAQNGRNTAVGRISNVESAVKDQVATARSCLERFGDMASRQTVSIGGVDVSPIRDAVFAQACNVIQSKTGQIASQYSQVVSQVTRAVGQAVNQGVQAPQAQTQSLWDRVSCTVLGTCN